MNVETLSAFVATALLAAAAVAGLRGWLQRRQILDHPNQRSSHKYPTPRGGGLALTPLILAGWALLAFEGAALPGTGWVIAGASLLLAVSWRDDRGGLSAPLRLALHAAAVALAILALPAGERVLGGALPLWADRLLAAVAWLWFVNLYNFMDGIDAISGIETLSLAGGLLLLGASPPQAAVLAGAAAGWLLWNWPPARIFLGDSGSIPLGYLTGWLLLRLAVDGHLAAAVILPAYYLADASLTLARRAWRREAVWRAHRQHFYQRAVARGASHAAVSLTILAGNLLLIGLALWSQQQPWPALAGALAVTTLLLRRLDQMGAGQGPEMVAGHHQGGEID